MDILLDLRWMKPGYTGGIESLARAFLNTLLEIDYSNHYTVLIPSEARFDFDLYGHKNFELINCDGPVYFLNRLIEKIGLNRDEAFREIIIAGHDIHCDVALSLAGYTNPDLMRLPTVLVVPDLQHEFFPQYFSAIELDNRKKAFTSSIENAQLICAISAFTRLTIIEKRHIAGERIIVTPLAVEPQFFQPPSPDAQNGVMKKYGLKPGYLFYPAATWPHKNHLALIQALQLLRDRMGIRIDLVCSGTAKEAQADISAAIQQNNLTGQVHFLGYVPQEMLGSLFRQAVALIFPSLFEGFGMPLLEAMACGCPVLCSNTSSLPEVAGDAAIFFDPTDPMAIALAIQRLLQNDLARQALIARGKVRVENYSWTRFTLQVLQQAFYAAKGYRSDRPFQEMNDTEAAKWLPVLIPNQPGAPHEKNGRSLMVQLKTSHHRLALPWLHKALDAKKQHQPLESAIFGLLAFVLSPRAAFISIIFPAIRDAIRQVRAVDQV
ncbi:MAG TPA: glycosyltransferase family 1 protein [Longilinea sp.]|nr:glycosyltransferase family 1 protein [Longilinea sp.]